MNAKLLTPGLLTLSAMALSIQTSVAESKHFHPKGEMPSEHTLKIFEQTRKTLPFSDRQDFEEQDRGSIAAPDYKKIMADAGHVAWDMERYELLNNPDAINSVHPSMLFMVPLWPLKNI